MHCRTPGESARWRVGARAGVGGTSSRKPRLQFHSGIRSARWAALAATPSAASPHASPRTRPNVGRRGLREEAPSDTVAPRGLALVVGVRGPRGCIKLRTDRPSWDGEAISRPTSSAAACCLTADRARTEIVSTRATGHRPVSADVMTFAHLMLCFPPA